MSYLTGQSSGKVAWEMKIIQIKLQLKSHSNWVFWKAEYLYTSSAPVRTNRLAIENESEKLNNFRFNGSGF